jgi:hypothetical protein
MKKRLAIWLISLSVFASIAIAQTPPCQAGPVLQTPTGLVTEEKIQFVFVTGGKTKANSTSTTNDNTYSIDNAVNGNEADAYVWIVAGNAGTAAPRLGSRGRSHYNTVGRDWYSSNEWSDMTKHQSNASGNRQGTNSQVLSVAAEVAERSKFAISIVCGASGHFP